MIKTAFNRSDGQVVELLTNLEKQNNYSRTS